ncbi:MAG: FAD-dependent oxidoreductase [Solirubrobacterales bacterium]
MGGGYTGLWTAIHLKERDPALDVVVIERDICGGGASGRNSGFLMSWWSKYPTLRTVLGRERALHLCRQSADAVRKIPAFCGEHGIEAGVRHGGWLWLATSRAQVDSWARAVKATDRDGAGAFQVLSAEEARERSGSPVALGGVFEQTVATVQPAALARGLRRVALESGVQIFENSPMTALRRGSPVVVETGKGEITAEKVVIAMNAWAARLAEVRRAIVVVATDVMVTPPVPEFVSGVPWSLGTAISDSHRLVNVLRSTPDGRLEMSRGGGGIVFRGRLDKQYDGRSNRTAEMIAHLHRMYPELAGEGADLSWRGPIDYSLGGLPWFGPLGNSAEIFVGVGFSGNGVGPSYLGAALLAGQVLERGDADDVLRMPPRGSLPPEPARYVGGNLVRKAIARKEAREDSGRPPRRLDAWLAGLDPTGFVD